ncbi:hypothetical protein G5B31_16320 [Rhodobacter sp. SGA-6-6]|uniref:hypothetical protein n=1 Tax=Rhodobacter sp. SGA-6-6 TaxID=2710882 RepID=UPI0013EC2D57|nr:hypothetical protein [Rhodobacter sp. SGA-6-6]NGM47103.1 hypothetical protein [Rhodobacter sp. SGA-6-6]
MPEPGEMAALRGLADIAALPLVLRHGGSAGTRNPASDYLSEINILRIILAHPTGFEPVTSAFGVFTIALRHATKGYAMTRHHTVNKRQFENPLCLGYPAARSSLLPAAYVVLTRNAAPSEESRHD